MERKAFHALLLSGIVAAGAVTIGDVYAQTNTDRLIAVVDNTDGLPGMLDALMTAISDGVASILAAISSLETHVDDGLHAIDEDLMAIDADLQSIHGDLTNVDADLQAVHGDLSAIDADLVNIHEDLMNVDADLVTIHDDLEMVHGDLTTMDGKIAGLTQTVNTMGQAASAITGLADANTATQEGVNANSAAINELKDLLMSVSEAVGAVQETVEAEPEEASTTVGTKLSKVDDDFGVMVSAFSQNKATATTYKTKLTFSCEEHVFVSRVDAGMDNSQPFIEPTVTPDPDQTVSITANDLPVYTNKLPTGTTTVAYAGGVDFRLLPLSAGDTLIVDVSTTKTTTDLRAIDVATTYPNQTFNIQEYLKAERSSTRIDSDGSDSVTSSDLRKADAGKVEALAINVVFYTSAADAKCTLKSPVSPSVDYSDTDETASGTLTAASGSTGAIREINDAVFTCDSDTAITKVVLEGIPLGFMSFIDLDIEADSKKSLKFENVTNVITAQLDDPLEFDGGEFTISGKIPGQAALVTVTYDTVSDSSCSAN